MAEAAPGIDPRGVHVVVPAYNEGPVVADVVGALLAVYPNVVAVDDGSSDDTHARLLATRAHVLRHEVNLGQGAALQTGISYALERGATHLVTFDADGQHRVEDVARLLGALAKEGADVALGSRFLAGRPSGIPRRRLALLRAATLFTRVVGGIRVTDTHNGLRAFTAAAAARLTITQPRMAHASEILHKINALGLRYVEVPIEVRYTERSLAKGQSTLDAINILVDLLVRRFLGRR